MIIIIVIIIIIMIIIIIIVIIIIIIIPWLQLSFVKIYIAGSLDTNFRCCLLTLHY